MNYTQGKDLLSTNQELPTHPEHVGIVLLNHVMSVLCFIDRCPLSFGHCIVCTSSNYGFLLPSNDGFLLPSNYGFLLPSNDGFLLPWYLQLCSYSDLSRRGYD